MRRVAIATLAHDALRTSMLVVGLAAAWTLVTVQLGLRRGFELSTRSILDHVGGDVWVGARGVRVVDDGEPVSASNLGDAPPCVERRRPVVVDYGQARRADGSLVTVQIIGVDPATLDRVPWALARGDRGRLANAGAAAIDAADASKLGLRGDGLGQRLELRSGATLHVDAVTTGARSFTQTPWVFVGIETARALLGLPEDAATFWVHDLREPRCADDVAAPLRARLATPRREELAASTSAHWIGGSGIGALLGAGGLTAAVVGAAVLLQSTITIVRTYTPELATVRALGARSRELAAFIAWQIGLVSAIATVLALALASGLSMLLEHSGLVVVVDGWSCAVGVAIATASTALAAAAGARVLGRLDIRKVLE